jgi:hypothetical protein
MKKFYSNSKYVFMYAVKPYVEVEVQDAAETVKYFKILVTRFSARVSRIAGI